MHKELNQICQLIQNIMKKLLSSLAGLLLVFAGYAQQQKVIITIKGSDTVLPISIKLSEKFSIINPGYQINIVGGGSGVGIGSLIEGDATIAQSSRKIKEEEIKLLKDSGRTIQEVEIGLDALAIVVNPANPIFNLTREEIEAIFTGRLDNWNQINGLDMPIVVFSRESSSGTYDFFKEHVLMQNDFTESSSMLPSADAVIESLSQVPGGIGYVGMGYINKDVKALKISYDKGKTYTEPSKETISKKTYPIIRPLFYYYTTEEEQSVRPFLNYVLSSEGLTIIDEEGYFLIH